MSGFMEVSRRLTGLRGPAQMAGLKPRRLVSGQFLIIRDSSSAAKQVIDPRSDRVSGAPFMIYVRTRESLGHTPDLMTCPLHWRQEMLIPSKLNLIRRPEFWFF